MAGAPKGNNNAAKGKMWSDAVRKALIQGKKLSKIADKLIEMAEAGDMQAIKEIGDRLDGKAVQQVNDEGSDGIAEALDRIADRLPD